MALASCEIRPSPLHGLGIFATERIEKGAIIIREEALWVVNKLQAMEATFPGLSDVEQMRKNMIDAFKPPISPATREFTNGVLSLAGGFDLNDRVDKDPTAAMIELTTTLREVLIRNGVTMDFRPHQDYVCVFKDASRLNHSCMANAVRTVGYSPDPLGFVSYHCCPLRNTDPLQ